MKDHKEVMEMLGFIAGTIFGGTAGVFVMAMCTAAKNADRHIEKERK